MQRLIKTEEQLRQLLPNIVQTVKGERPYLTALSEFLTHAEDWVEKTFTSPAVFETICGLEDGHIVKSLTARLVVAEALRRAIPSLDIVLTPNGFGIVNSSNIAPASSQRVDRLLESMVKERDECIAALLPKLPEIEGWLDSVRAEYFGATLFPTLDIVEETGTFTGSKWSRYIELHQKIFDVEASLAEEWFSPELMAKLRRENISGKLKGERRYITRRIQAQIVEFLKDGSLNGRTLADIVNYIRRCHIYFKEWHKSDTAKLFSPTVFENKKNSSGYFF